MLRILLLPLALAGSGWAFSAAAEPSLASPETAAVIRSYSIRGDRALSRRLNPVLGRIGMPVVHKLPEGENAERFVGELCGFARPAWTYAGQDPTGRTIEIAPCLLAEKQVEIPVRRGDSTPAIGMHIGLLEGSLGTLRVRRTSGKSGKGLVDLHQDDRVIVPEYPLWTPIAVPAAKAPDRTALMVALAEGLPCNDTESADDCLARFRVGVIDDTPKPIAPRPPRVNAAAIGERPDTVARSVSDGPAVTVRDEAVALAQGPRGAAPTPTIAAGSPVATGQWPLDPVRVQRLLAGTGAGGHPRRPVAVIDVGLQTGAGDPLPEDTFARADPEASDLLRRFGDGVPFAQTGASSVSICEDGLAGPAAGVLDDEALREEFSHGAVTSSIATGYAFRKARAGAIPAEILPQLLFVRLYGGPCPPAGMPAAKPSDVIRAVQKVSGQVDIINLSYQDDGGESSGLPDALMNAIRASQKVLVVPAGNDGAEDLGASVGQFCPACLANPLYEKGGPAIARRVLAVGAATSLLEVEHFSGKGWPAVFLYAPGDALDAVDIAGRDAPPFEPSTSYAAPRVAFATALASSLVPGATMDRVVKRIGISTWPLYERDEEGRRRRAQNGGVLDLTKVAAVRTFAVEAWVEENGQRVLKTYVGPLATPMKSLALCGPGQEYPADVWMGIAIGPPGTASGYRQTVFYPQFFEDEQFKTRTANCRPAGNVVIQDLVDGPVTLPLESVTRILTPLRNN